MMTDHDRQYISHMAAALCQRAAVLHTHIRTQRTALKDQRAQLTAHRYRLQELIRQQRRIRAACCPTQGWKRNAEIVVLTKILSRLRRPYDL